MPPRRRRAKFALLVACRPQNVKNPQKSSKTAYLGFCGGLKSHFRPDRWKNGL
jgi:hypothetical protein